MVRQGHTHTAPQTGPPRLKTYNHTKQKVVTRDMGLQEKWVFSVLCQIGAYPLTICGVHHVL
eukprot:53515-Eustigmatos_ZCMA.PRE.1